MNFKVGDTHQAKLTTDKPYKIHIVAVVDSHMIVFKCWYKHRQGWFYQVMTREGVESRIKWATVPSPN